MKVIVVQDYEAMSLKAAQIIASHVTLKSNSVLGLATGSTAVGMYDELVRMFERKQIDFNEVTTFNLDEYYPLNSENENSYHAYMNAHLFGRINVPSESIHIPSGMADNVEFECQSYEERIQDAGGIDIQVLGIGRNGHIGFNEPDIKFEARTHLVELDKKTIEDNSRFFSSIEEVPKHAISMGVKTIMHAKKIMLLASGIEKSDAIYEMIHGKIVPTLPASVLQLHPEVIVILDEAAASLLSFDAKGNVIERKVETQIESIK